jgi:uncharacterized membrane protein
MGALTAVLGTDAGGAVAGTGGVASAAGFSGGAIAARVRTLGAINARFTAVSAQNGHSSRPRCACSSKLALLLNQPSKSWPAAHCSA